MDVFLVYQGAPGDLLKAAVDLGAKGLVMATAGAGAVIAGKKLARKVKHSSSSGGGHGGGFHSSGGGFGGGGGFHGGGGSHGF